MRETREQKKRIYVDYITKLCSISPINIVASLLPVKTASQNHA
jgi:hypothetical protein